MYNLKEINQEIDNFLGCKDFKSFQIVFSMFQCFLGVAFQKSGQGSGEVVPTCNPSTRGEAGCRQRMRRSGLSLVTKGLEVSLGARKTVQ